MGLLALVGGMLLKMFSFEVLKYLALRAMLIALCLGIGPIVIFKGFSYIMQFLMTWAGGFVEGQELEPVVVQLFGVGAYLGSLMKIPEGISIFLGFCLLSFTLRMVRVK